MDNKLLTDIGFENTSPGDYYQKDIVLRDKRKAILWIHKQTGHGILDPEFWEDKDYYTEKYRKEFSAKPGKEIEQAEHLRIYRELNLKQFNTISHYLTAKTKYLEIGCSFGGVFNLVSEYCVAECHAVEPNEKDAAFVNQNNPHAKISNTSLEDAILPKNYYDLIVSNEVLEHTVNPGMFLRKCYPLLRDYGVLHIEVPNHNDVLLSTYQNDGYKKFYYHKAHIHYFTASSLHKLCHDCGFSGNVSSFLMYPFFNQVWWYHNQRPQSSASMALATPIPAAENTRAEKAINDFYKDVEDKYEKLINSHMLGDCLIFQGNINEQVS